MIYINRGKRFPEEVESYIGQKVTVIDLSKFERGEDADYQFWKPIRHPETGELLSATQGYIGDKDFHCYAEYRNNKGEYFNYTHANAIYNKENTKVLAPAVNISEQMRRDGEVRESNLQRAEARTQFSQAMRSEQPAGQAADPIATRESARRDFGAMMNGDNRSSSTQTPPSQSRDNANKNDRNI